jgi:hypothetical protein
VFSFFQKLAGVLCVASSLIVGQFSTEIIQPRFSRDQFAGIGAMRLERIVPIYKSHWRSTK